MKFREDKSKNEFREDKSKNEFRKFLKRFFHKTLKFEFFAK